VLWHSSSSRKRSGRIVKLHNRGLARLAPGAMMRGSLRASDPMAIFRTTEPRGTFRVTYETVTAESAEQGDYAESGWLDWLGSPVDQYCDSVWDLRDLADKLAGCSAEGDGDRVPRWITLDPGANYLAGITPSVLRPTTPGLCGSLTNYPLTLRLGRLSQPLRMPSDLLANAAGALIMARVSNCARSDPAAWLLSCRVTDWRSCRLYGPAMLPGFLVCG